MIDQNIQWEHQTPAPRPSPEDLVAEIWSDLDRIRQRGRTKEKSLGPTVASWFLGPLWAVSSPTRNRPELQQKVGPTADLLPIPTVQSSLLIEFASRCIRRVLPATNFAEHPLTPAENDLFSNVVAFLEASARWLGPESPERSSGQLKSVPARQAAALKGACRELSTGDRENLRQLALAAMTALDAAAAASPAPAKARTFVRNLVQQCASHAGDSRVQYREIVRAEMLRDLETGIDISQSRAAFKAAGRTKKFAPDLWHPSPPPGWYPPVPSRTDGPVLSSDGNKNRFGGKSAVDGYALTAKLTLVPQSEWTIVELSVRRTRGLPRLAEPVRFSLHPTFERPIESVPPESTGLARLLFPCWGAFTVGAEILATARPVRLELDLATVKNASRAFLSR